VDRPPPTALTLVFLINPKTLSCLSALLPNLPDSFRLLLLLLLLSAGASVNEPPPELQQLALNFLATFFSRHPPEQQPSFSSAWDPLYGLSLPIKPFQDTLYTAIWPFSPCPPSPVGGEAVRGWSAPALLLLLLLLLLVVV